MRHTAISASAGSGKTFALAHRYIALLAGGVHPDRIIAMTFSRKAAGEIFDEIVKYLCRAAASNEEASATARRIGRPSLGSGEFLRMLRCLTDSLHRAHIGTLDSFTVSVIRAFPMELGVASDFRVMDGDGAEARSVRQEILNRIFTHPRVSPGTRREFLEAFKQATFGREEKGLQRNLDRFVAEYRSKYQASPEGTGWGVPATIWPDSPEWLAQVKDAARTADELMESLEEQGLPANIMKRWCCFCAAVRDYGIESPWTRDIEYLFDKLAAELDSIRGGDAVIRMERKECPLNRRQCRLVLRLVHHLMHIEVTRALTRTGGIFSILDQYEQVYDAVARSGGHLTFDDVQFMLTEANLHSGGKVLSRREGEPAKLYIDYRLDCQLDHWLLDEFQDTSDLQWRALSNLVDEILQDDTCSRTFFYVGDVKQAIYGWRGGNARLFDKVLDRYRERIETKRLDASYRSCPQVIDTVNRVFTGLPEESLPPAALDYWAGLWREHTCAEGLRNVRGYAALLEPNSDGGSVKPGDRERFEVVASLIREMAPVERGLSVAVLVRKNESGRKMVDLLRRECEGLTIIHEGKAPITDNPVVAALLSLVKLAEHPGDEFARRHVLMTPLNQAVEELGREADLSVELLRRIHADGYRAFVAHWGAALDRAYPLDDFGRLRMNDLVDAAGMFDEEGGGSCGDFLRFVGNHDIRDLSAEGAVTVMTVHQAKGLGFDVVILPDLMSGSLDKALDVDLLTPRDPVTNRPRWILEMPRRTIAENDCELEKALRQCNEDACFESLCVLYVAMTRARRALYIITSFPGKTSKAMTPAALVKMQLAGDPKPVDGAQVDIAGTQCVRLYETGNPDWYKDVSAAGREPETPDPVLPEDFAGRPSLRTPLDRVAPSMQDTAAHSAGWLFAGENREVLCFGRAIHELFEAVEWIEDADVEAIVSAWLSGSDDSEEVKRDVCEQFRRAVADPSVRLLMSRPKGHVDLWREKQFEIVLDGRWVTGAFDRVVICRDAGGKPVRAVIIDYKSNRICQEPEFAAVADGYRPQLELYGRALSGMLHIPEGSIDKKLIFTRAARVFDL